MPAQYQSLAVVQMLWAITTDSVLTFEATMMRTRLTAYSLGNLDGTNPHYLIQGTLFPSSRVFKVESGTIVDVMSLDCATASQCGRAAYGSEFNHEDGYSD